MRKSLRLSVAEDSSLLRLEPRYLFDAAALAAIDVEGIDTDVNEFEDLSLEQVLASSQQPEFNSETQEIEAILAEDNTSTLNEIVFIDTSVDGYQQILDDIKPSIKVVLLDANKDGLAQIEKGLEEGVVYDAVHIVSHGDSGHLELGSSTLNESSMNGEYLDDLQRIGQMLSAQADILVYGCNFGEGEEGVSAFAALASATGLDVAASDDVTGSAELDGDWDLELKSGDIEADSLQSSSFVGSLAIAPNVTYNFEPDLTNANGATVNTWQSDTANVYDFSFSGVTYNINPGSNYPGIISSYTFDGDANPANGGNADSVTFLSPTLDTSDVTLELWVKPDAVSGTEMLYETGATGDGLGIAIHDNSVYLGVKDSALDGLISVSLAEIDITEFFQITATGEDTGGGMTWTLYVKGIDNGTGSGTAGELFEASSSTGEIAGFSDFAGGNGSGLGRDNGGNALSSIGGEPSYANYNGEIAIFRLYDTALSAAEVDGNYEAITNPDLANAVDDNAITDEDTAIVIDVINNDTGDGVAITSVGVPKVEFLPQENLNFNLTGASLSGTDGVTPVTSWLDETSNNFNAGTVTIAPVYDNTSFNGYGAVDFSADESGLTIGNSSLLNLANASADKTFALVIETGSSVTGADQVIYEQGGQTNGLNIYISDGSGTPRLYANIWEGGAAGDYDQLDLGAVAASTEYTVIVEYDTSGGVLRGSVNGGAFVVNTDNNVGANIPGHSGAIGIGQFYQDTRTYNNTAAGGDGLYFTGKIAEISNWNNIFTGSELTSIQNYLDNVKNNTPISSAGTVSFNALDGTISFDPGTDFDYLDVGESVDVSIEYTIEDAAGNTDTATVVVTVTGLNDAPDAVDDIAVLDGIEDSTSGVLNALLLANDSDPNNDAVSIAYIEGVALTGGIQSIAVTNGTVNVDASDNITFTADADYNGVVSFEYTIDDGNGGLDTAIASGTISAVNDNPELGANTSVTTTAGSVSVGDFAATDIDGDNISYTLSGANAGLFSISAAGVVTFNTAPVAGDGPYSITITATDDGAGTLTDTQNLTILVGSLSASDDDIAAQPTYNLDEQDLGVLVVGAAEGVLANDTVNNADVTAFAPGDDANWDASSATDNTLADSDGNNLGNWDFASGAVLNDVDSNYPGITKAYDTSLGGATTTINFDADVDERDGATFEIWVRPTDFTTTTDQIIFETGTAGGDGVAIYLNGSILTFYVQDAGRHSPEITYDLSSVGYDEFIQIAASTSLDEAGSADFITLFINGVEISSSATGDLRDWTDDGGAGLGQVNGTSVASDNNGGATLTNFQGEIALFRLYTNGPNSDLNITEVENNFSNIANHIYVSGIDNDGSGGSYSTIVEAKPGDSPLLVNSTAAVGVTENGGSVTMYSDGSFEYTQPSGVYDYLAVGETATDTFSYRITDALGNEDTATVSITINGVNDAPIAINHPNILNGFEDVTSGILNGALLAGATDIDTNDVLFVSAIDGVTLTGGAQVINLFSGQGTVTVDALDNITFTAAANYNGVVSFNYTISDGNGGADMAVASGTIIGAPDAVADTNIATELGVTISGNILANDDIGVGPSTITAADEGGMVIAFGTPYTAASGGVLTLNSDGSYTYVPPPSVSVVGRVDQFNYTLTDDNGNTSISTLTINVTDNSDTVPIAVDDNSFTVLEDNSLSGDVSTNDTLDVAGEPYVYASDATSLNGGTISMNADGTFTYTPALNFNGTDTFNYTVTDADGDSASALVTITVNADNDSAIFSGDISGSGTEDGGAITGTLIVTDTADGIMPTDFTISANGVNGTATINPITGDWTYSPDANFNGTDSFTVTVTDDDGNTETQIITVTIASVDDSVPFATIEDTPSIALNATLESSLATYLTGTLTVTHIEGVDITTGLPKSVNVTDGVIDIDVGGNIIFTPDLNYNGTTTFNYTLSNGSDSDDAVASGTITPVNDAPILGADGAVSVGVGNLLVGSFDAENVDGDNISYTLSGTDAGLFAVNSLGLISFVAPPAFGDGPYSVTITATDDGVGTLTDTQALTITIVNANAVDDDGYAINENGAINLTDAANGVLANDTYVEATLPALDANDDRSWVADGSSGSTWSSPGSGNSLDWSFGGGVSPITVDSNYPGITHAYDITADGGATTASFADFATENRDASFELWIKPDSLPATGDQIIFETGSSGGDGIAIYLTGNTLTLYVKDGGQT